ARFTPARSDGSRFRTAASFASSEGYQGRSPWLSEFFDQLRARLSLPARGIDSLAVVVWWMMWQRLDGRGSLATAVQQVVQGALGDLVPPEKRVVEKRVSSHTGALSRARTRLPLEAAEAVCDQVFATLIQSAQAGPAVAVVSGGWLLDAPAAHASLREGLSARWQSAWEAHWPVIRVLTAHHW